MDFEKHNKEVKEVWDAYNNGKPIRVPMILGMNLRMIFLDKHLNSKGITFKDYFENPDVMWNKEIKFGLFFNRAIKEGADFIATGHYVRIKRKSQTTNHKSQINPKLKNKFENLNIENSLEIVN